jgi:hypothetical protein
MPTTLWSSEGGVRLLQHIAEQVADEIAGHRAGDTGVGRWPQPPGPGSASARAGWLHPVGAWLYLDGHPVTP